mmetsp:Transcript_23544/g.36712  ORF Transcript_23544/g.36712 Transcript_23544/m.36712 type:complete len:266 (-) Transcript_23544:37-834(-)
MLTLLTLDASKVDKLSLPDQSLMELLLVNFNDPRAFKNVDGTYMDVALWLGVTFRNDNVAAIGWSDDPFQIRERRVQKKGGYIDLQWIPDGVTEFDISFLQLAGECETVKLPRGLHSFQIRSNRFSGSFSVKGLPRTLVNLDIRSNLLEGNLDLTCLPPALERLYGHTNSFSGTIVLTALPETLVHVSLHDNLFEGTINLESLPPVINILDLTANRLKQESIVLPSTATNRAMFWFEKGSCSKIFDENGNDRCYNDSDTSLMVLF